MMAVRRAQKGDINAVCALWRECFGDSEEFVRDFFASLGHVTTTLLLEDEDGVFGMGHLLTLGDAVSERGEKRPCAVTYALGVSSGKRSAGGGETLTRALIGLARSRDLLPLICPAEKSLFGYYEKKAGYKTAFYACEQTFPAADGALCEEIDGAEYLRIRERLLEGTAHVAVSEDIMNYQQKLCRASGGGLFRLTCDGKSAVAAVENWGKAAAKEILSPFGAEKAAGAAAKAVGADEIRARFPGEEPFAMCAEEYYGGWFGFAFD